ncbi:MAG TPA: FadR/GntR family transcriptional regulator [Sphingomonas sp.]|nr:FadR/GntR family transcriptional regulator [Sphingomonas sp.]
MAKANPAPIEPLNEGDEPRITRPHNAVARRLGIAILAGDYVPGDLLANEEEASAGLNVSRGAYREAIRTLAAKGLVQSRPKIGTRINPIERWNLLDTDVLTWLFAREPDERLINDLFGLRLMVEPEAARLAALNWTEEEFPRLRAAMEGLIGFEPSSERWQQADKDFHDTIIRMAGNAFLTTLAGAITTAVRLTTKYKLRVPGEVANSTIEHLRVYEAISVRDGDLAAEQAYKLIEGARETTLYERRRAARADGRMASPS